MKYYSTNRKAEKVGLKEAVLKGLAPDGGLYMPETIPQISQSFFDTIRSLTFSEIAQVVAEGFFKKDIPLADLRGIVEKATTISAPLIPLSDTLYTLELFHGPTLSFKDFGVSFMAQLVAFLMQNDDRELHILAATSGDTGSAVGHGFLKIPGIRVWILYPKGQISYIQEKQLTTMGHNVSALEIEGSFDDCQALVKQVFNDRELTSKLMLTSANSINIARLIPQIFYYFWGYAQLPFALKPIAFSVPSGNFGNLVACELAKMMGLPIDKIIAATNINDTIPRFLSSGVFTPSSSKRTISNAMDVGNPSNFVRILELFGHDVKKIQRELFGAHFTDSQTEAGIKLLWKEFSYVADPHGAVGYLGLSDYQRMFPDTVGVFLETAHPAKFLDIIEPLIEAAVDVPVILQQVLDKKKQTTSLGNHFNELKEFLLGV